MPAVQADARVRQFTTGADCQRAAASLKQKFRAPAALPVKPSNAIDGAAAATAAATPPAAPVTAAELHLRQGAILQSEGLPASEASIRDLQGIVQAFAERFNITVDDLQSNIDDPTAIAARKLCAAFMARWLNIRTRAAADLIGISADAVGDGLALVDAVFARVAVSRTAPRAAVVAMIYRDWIEGNAGDLNVVTLNDIKRAVAREFRIPKIDLESARRTANIVVPRHVAMGLARRLTRKSLPEIGRQFGGRDHTTVLHGARKSAGLIERVALELPRGGPIAEWARLCRVFLAGGFKMELPPAAPATESEPASAEA
jgi:hypothetical protein